MRPTSFDSYLDKSGEIGHVARIDTSLIYLSGLPGARIGEIVVFEDGQKGWVLSLNEYVLVVTLSATNLKLGARAARTGQNLSIQVTEEVLGKSLDPLLTGIDAQGANQLIVDIDPPGIGSRVAITKPLRTGVTICDLIVPISKGQRELIIGDRKTGKTAFALNVIATQAKEGTICILAHIGKRAADIAATKEFIKEQGISDKVVTVDTRSSDPPGLIFLAPYTALTIAEYFRDQGKDTIVVLDDMTAHARAYREISLTAKRFPGRDSYPGDIFNAHARIMERGGNFAVGKNEAAITLLPIAQSVVGDLSGYIETNLMSMTDGHLFFDIDEFEKGRRPAINPFLSVTRVGHQTQSTLKRIMSREVVSFLVEVEKLEEFMHFGAELSELSRSHLELGELIMTLFEQRRLQIIPFEVDSVLLASLWAGHFKGMQTQKVKEKIHYVRTKYGKDAKHKQRIDKLIAESKTFGELIRAVDDNQDLIFAA